MYLEQYIESIQNELNEHGFVEIENGVWIFTSEQVTYEQKDWDVDDPCKNKDFSLYPFWTLTNDARSPEGHDSVLDTLEYLLEWCDIPRC